MSATEPPDSKDPAREVARQIDQLCLKFEDEWIAGRTPAIEDFLAEVSALDQDGLLCGLVQLEWNYRTARSESPTTDAYIARFPDHERSLTRLFVRMGLISRAGLQAGARIGRYEIAGLIGTGTFGSVYTACDRELDRCVAIKEASSEFCETQKDIDRTLVEARSIAKLNHPGIVSVYDIIDDAYGFPLLVMEFVDGPTLLEAMQAGQFPSSRIATLLADIAEAIDFAHQRGFVHRDLKPSNIRLDALGNPRILDFGLAIHESTQSLKEGESAGSLAYMSPEQVLGRAHWLDGRSDIWALGVIMYETLTGRRPFHGQSVATLAEAIQFSDPKPPRQIDRKVPRELERICLKCLHKAPAQRYTTASDLAQDLRQFAASAVRPLFFPTVSRTRLSLIFAAATLLVLMAFAGATRMLPRQAVPLNATVDLKVWDRTNPQRCGIGLRDAEALPLKPGDQVRLQIKLTAPAYLYVFWINSEGQISPVFPWKAGDWRRYPPDVQPVSSLNLPSAATEAWPITDGPSGMETIAVCVSNSPWDKDDWSKLAKLKLEPQTGPTRMHLLEWTNGELAVPELPRTRSVDLQHPTTLDDAVIENQQLIDETLGNSFALRYSMNFPCQSSKSSN